MAFDINDRTTWDWVDGGAVPNKQDGEYSLNPADRHSFYQYSMGVPVLHQCPSGLIFNPELNVCDWPSNISEADIYDWAVKNNLVRDQR